MSKVVIGVHGLGNKPPKELLEKWWKQAIVEGLRRNNNLKPDFNFELVYRADILHKAPLDPNETNKENSSGIKIEDILVHNNFKTTRIRNPHKS